MLPQAVTNAKAISTSKTPEDVGVRALAFLPRACRAFSIFVNMFTHQPDHNLDDLHLSAVMISCTRAVTYRSPSICTSASQAVLSRMQLILPATRQAPHVSLRARCKQAMSAWSAKTRRALSRHCRDARVYDHATTPMRDAEHTHPRPLPAKKCARAVSYIISHGKGARCDTGTQPRVLFSEAASSIEELHAPREKTTSRKRNMQNLMGHK